MSKAIDQTTTTAAVAVTAGTAAVAAKSRLTPLLTRNPLKIVEKERYVLRLVE